jgi:hypothetical protein
LDVKLYKGKSFFLSEDYKQKLIKQIEETSLHIKLLYEEVDILIKDRIEIDKVLESIYEDHEYETLEILKKKLKKLESDNADYDENDLDSDKIIDNIELINLIKELKAFKEELKNFIRENCDSTISSEDIDTLIFYSL